MKLMAACPQSELDADTVKSILVNTNFIMLKWLQSDAASDGLIEALGETVYIPRMCILSEIYQISTEESAIIYKVTHYPFLPITTGLLKTCWKIYGTKSN